MTVDVHTVPIQLGFTCWAKVIQRNEFQRGGILMRAGAVPPDVP